MNLRALLFCVLLLPAGAAAADESAGVPSAHDMLRSRLAEEARTPTPAAQNGVPVTPTAEAQLQGTVVDADKNPLLAPNAAPSATKESAKKTQKEPATVLPKVEVRKGRITKLDQDLAKQEQEIAREKKNTKPSEMDKALNDVKIAKPLAIFGGESSQFRQHVASERVSLMEDEKDLIEAIAHAKTKAEKAELQKQLDELRAERRELERALR